MRRFDESGNEVDAASVDASAGEWRECALTTAGESGDESEAVLVWHPWAEGEAPASATLEARVAMLSDALAELSQAVSDLSAGEVTNDG